MQNLNRIVVATDFSAAAKRAVSRAALIAQQHGAELHLVHVVSPLSLYPGQDIGSVADDGTPLADARAQLDAAAQGLHQRYGLRARVAERIGRAHTQIAEYVDEIAADLVVAGARGENSMLRLLLGSTALRLVRVCRCPVLIVRCESVEPYRQVLAAVDFFPHTRAVCAWASRLAGGAPMHLLHVVPMSERDMRQAGQGNKLIRQHHEEMLGIAHTLMSNLRSDLSCAAEGHVSMGYPPVQILQHATGLSPDLIVLGRQGQGGLEAYLLGSVSKAVVQAADCDVLLVGTS